MRKQAQRKRVGSYVRVSSREQVEGYSLEAQATAIRQWCEMFKDEYEIVAEYRDEGISATHEDISRRPGFKAAVKAVKAGEIDAIIVHKFDRAARSMYLFLEVMREIDGQLISVMQRADYTDASGKLFVNMLMAFSQYYSDNLSDETKKGLKERKRQGLYHARLPFGAAMADGDKRSPPISDTEIVLTDSSGQEWSKHAVVAYVFTRAAEGASLSELKTELGQIGFSLSRSALSYMLHNQFYIGKLPVEHRRDASHRYAWQEIEWVDGAHDPLIPPALFERAQRGMDGNKRGAGVLRQTVRPHLFTGLGYCGRCGSSLHCDSDKGKPRVLCSSRHDGSECDQPAVRQVPLFEQLMDHLERIAPRPEHAAELIDRLKDGRKDLAAERRSLEGKLRKLKLLFLESDMTDDDYHAQKADVERQIALCASQRPSGPVLVKTMDYLRDMRTAMADANVVERNILLRYVLTKVVIDGKQIRKLGFQPMAHRMLIAHYTEQSRWDLSHSGAFSGQVPFIPTQDGMIELAPLPPQERHMTPRQPSKIDVERWPEVATLHASGLSMTTIAAKYGVSKQTISKVLRRYDEAGGKSAQRVS